MWRGNGSERERKKWHDRPFIPSLVISKQTIITATNVKEKRRDENRSRERASREKWRNVVVRLTNFPFSMCSFLYTDTHVYAGYKTTYGGTNYKSSMKQRRGAKGMVPCLPLFFHSFFHPFLSRNSVLIAFGLWIIDRQPPDQPLMELFDWQFLLLPLFFSHTWAR